MSKLDVVLFRAEWTSEASAEPWIADPVTLGHGIQIRPIEKPIADFITELCDAQRLNEPWADNRPPVRYAFVGQVADQSSWLFDERQLLRKAIAVSRLIQPTAIGFEFSARVNLAADGDVQEGVAGPIKGRAAFGFEPPQAPQLRASVRGLGTSGSAKAAQSRSQRFGAAPQARPTDARIVESCLRGSVRTVD